jgi:hypothetical protein
VARGRERNRAFFSGLVRGVSNLREGSKSLTFLFGPRLVCTARSYISEALLRSFWKVDSANYFALCAFSDVRQNLQEYCI